ncbi:ATP-binding cassette domain-containing protein [Corynebacterium sp. sy039]|uniref:ATP-binding cassette domain-containing protein n=1 Tax=Corynebacterium sp. sy039 TaxID=2599641 RepID=UPI0011B4BC72|nr:ATP-binding cassette domain-containing protein [Corynebacterium sp. sy039]QDZ41927.1 ATP-binding cassette domain-containing protein [Corynebacterium sp. sy039]
MSSPIPTPAITFTHISKQFSKNPVLKDINFHITPGRVHALLGRNGAGKSTLLSILLGLLSADSGSVTIHGEELSREKLRTIGASINGPAFYGHLSARNNLRVHTSLLGLDPSEADRALETVGLGSVGKKKAAAFSTGMKARLALAQAILGDPEILVLDEPQNGLDPQAIAQLRELLRAWAASGGTVLVSSHQLGEVAHLADDVTVLADGKVMYSGTLHGLVPEGNLRDLEAEFFRLTSSGGQNV